MDWLFERVFRQELNKHLLLIWTASNFFGLFSFRVVWFFVICNFDKQTHWSLCLSEAIKFN